MTTLILKQQGRGDDMGFALFFLGIAAFFLIATTIMVYAYAATLG